MHYDVIIIGGGPGGTTAAKELAAGGKKVAIIEDKHWGGTCLNCGCIPTKTLVYEAHKSLCRGERSFEEKAADYRRAIARKNEVTGFLRGKNYAMLADRDNVDVITGTASFVSPHEVEVKTADKTLLLSGERIFINPGGETVIPPIEGVRENPRVYTSTTMLELEDLPRRLVILGGGYIALEFASFYAEFGSRVTILERGSRFLAREDADVADSVRKALENKGVTIITGASASAVRDAGDEAEVRFILDGTEQALPADAILLATGRRPLTAGLNLEAAGVKTTEQGAIAVDERLQTSVPHIWALGDVKGVPQFTYISLDDFRIVRDALYGEGKRVASDRDPAYTVFMDPPLGRVGLTEQAARDKNLDIKVAVLPAAAIPRLMGETTGMLKAVVDAKTGAILGCALHCADAGEMINVVETAIRAGKGYTFLRDMIYTHPSMTEALNDLLSKIK
mgnify:CR=1 FL=1